MSAYKEFSGKTVEEALRLAREDFEAGLDDLDFEILTPGSRGVLGMGAEPARIVAAPRAALGGAAPKRDAAASTPLPPTRDQDDRPPRRDDRGPRRDDRPPRRDDRPPRQDAVPPQVDAPVEAPASVAPRTDDRPPRPPRRDDRGPRRDDRPPRRDDRPAWRRRRRWPDGVRGRRGGRRPWFARRRACRARGGRGLARGARRRQGDPRAADDPPRFRRSRSRSTPARRAVSTSSAKGDERDALGALIGRKGERLSALQHLVNLMLSKEMGSWTRVLVDVEDYRGRRERQLRDLAEAGRRPRRRDRQDAPAGADARARTTLDPPDATRPRGRGDAVDRRGTEPARRPRPARTGLTGSPGRHADRSAGVPTGRPTAHDDPLVTPARMSLRS